jgi:transmembrane sensor
MTDESPRRPDPSSAAPPDWDVIARYVDGESSAEESARVAQWLERHPEDKQLVEGLNASAVVDGAADVDVEAALNRVRGRMNDAAARPVLTLERSRAKARQRVMASVALVAAAAVVFVVFQRRRDDTRAAAPATTVYETKMGQRDSVRLADGSRVILGPESRLTVANDFASAARRAVSLEGDAYFDVVHNAAKPFVVHVANAIVEDVGTTFTVETDPGDITTVAVMSGIVRLRPAAAPAATNSGVLLNAGDRGTLAADGDIRAEPKTVVADDSAWTTGRLVFRNASLDRVASELRRWYGFKLVIADSSLRSRTLRAEFDAGQPIDKVLDIISLTLGARIERAGSDSATIHARRGF